MQANNGPIVMVFRHAWILFVVITCANGGIWWYRAQPRIAEDRRLESGYRRLVRSWLIYGNLPWLVMGAGILFGGVPSVFHYFNPRNGPFVIAFYITIVALWIATFYWLFFRGGAEDLIAHPGLLNLAVQRPWAVKTFFVLALTGGVLGLLAMIFGNIQVPMLR
jgi:hypothetical protein